MTETTEVTLPPLKQKHRALWALGDYPAVASEVIARSDCLVVVGAGWNALTTLKGEIFAGKRVVQIDSDPGAIGRYFTVGAKFKFD